jgi:hypothetical protein
VAQLHADALTEDAAIFDYDSHFDSIQEVRAQSLLLQEGASGHSGAAAALLLLLLLLLGSSTHAACLWHFSSPAPLPSLRHCRGTLPGPTHPPLQARAEPKKQEKLARQSRYIAGLLEKAEERKAEQDILYERQLAKERAAGAWMGGWVVGRGGKGWMDGAWLVR